MRSRYISLFFSVCISFIAIESFGKVIVSGYVQDAATGEELIGANVTILEIGKGTITNTYGYYSLSLDPGSYTLVYSYIGYVAQRQSVNLDSDIVLNIELGESLQELEEVTITAEAGNANITRVETGSVQLPIQSIRKIPALLGEVDVIKAIQLLPGVQVTSEGSSGFSVRGGSHDQNLILLDEATIYNASHLMGFFSVFNNDAIKDVKLYKGDIPASSGGRLASLLDIRMKNGNNKRFSATGGIGTISSRLTLEGPVFTEKASFLLSARRTYADIFLPLAKDTAVRDNSLFFFDLNGKLNYMVNDKNRIYLSGYYGKDVFANDFAGMYFGNRTFTFRWNHLFSKKLFSNFTLVNSHYFYDLGTPEGEIPFFNWISFLEDYGFKGDFIWYPSPEHTFRYGLSSFYHVIKPGSVTARDQDGNANESELSNNLALENGIYFSGESKIGDRFAMRYGLRYSMFHNVGDATVFSYNDVYEVVDSTFYEKGEFYNLYHGLEPRIALNCMLNERNSIKASYSRNRQYLQMASNSTAGTPLDIWFPASPNIEPQISDQLAMGYFRNSLDNRIESSVELYYKKMTNSIDFRDHAQLLLNPRLEGELRIGDATSYGAELFIKYETPQLSGWISYTYSKITRDIPEINNGIPYPAPYEKPHDLALVFSYNLTDRIGLAANWIYSTGIPFTLPSGRYEVLGSILPLYTGRNEYRLPDYHRLDVSVTITGKEKPGRRWQSEWNFSVYNAYARKNIWTINFIQDNDNPDLTYAEMTYLFSIIPAITYNFKF
ncbi:MAG: TonB-dependent receptor [Bacteroidales bacterium]|nr:TonB-dependent receptor [Bacteroidales bacterium]